MDQILNLAPPFILFSILLIAAVGAFIHGLTGLGFPLIATPIIALLIDFKTAILITVIPNIAVNLCSILRGGNWRLSLGKHWPIAVYVVIGSIIGTHFVIYFNSDLLKLLLAGMILFYLNTGRLKQMHAKWITQYPQTADAGFGLVSGVLSGTTNVGAPPLIIYFTMLNLAPLAMVQTLNLCFIVSKATQLITFGIAGKVNWTILAGGLILALFSVGFLVLGMHIQGKMKVETYRLWLNKMLFFIAIILILQSVISLTHAG